MSRSFNGSSSRLDSVGGSPVTGYPHSISVWVKPANTTQAMVAASLEADDDSQSVLGAAGQNSGDPFQAYNRSSVGSFGIAQGGGPFNTTDWWHVMGSFDANNFRRLLVNGVSAGTNSSHIAIGELTRFILGTRLSGIQWFHGLIAEVAVYDVGITGSQDPIVIALAAGENPLTVSPDNLRSYSTLNGSGATENDLASGVYHLAVTDAPWNADHPPVDSPPSTGRPNLSKRLQALSGASVHGDNDGSPNLLRRLQALSGAKIHNE